MLIKESLWYKQQIKDLESKNIFPMLNIGSSTLRFREKSQPWIDKNIFKPLNNKTIIHLDLKKERGVDLAGDITSAKFIKKISSKNIKSIICANLLEHFNPQKRKQTCQNITNILPSGGYLLVSCPYHYPIHFDPIDNGFRPKPKKLASYFPQTKIIRSKIVIDHNYLYYLIKNKAGSLKIFVRLLFPFYKYREWKTLANHLPWMFKRFAATCVLLKKI